MLSPVTLFAVAGCASQDHQPILAPAEGFVGSGTQPVTSAILRGARDGIAGAVMAPPQPPTVRCQRGRNHSQCRVVSLFGPGLSRGNLRLRMVQGCASWSRTEVGMRRSLFVWAGPVGLLIAVCGCTNPYDPAQRAIGGGLIGAGTGAAIGAAAAGGHGAAIGAAVGGVTGLLAGIATTPPPPPAYYGSGYYSQGYPRGYYSPGYYGGRHHRRHVRHHNRHHYCAPCTH